MMHDRADPAAGSRSELIRAICDFPSEDAPRLRYADYLEASGDHDDILRADFIRVQCELARLNLSKERWAQLYERRKSLETHCDRWTAELPKLDGIRWNPFDYRRGFVWDVWCDDAEVFRRNAAAVFATAPIQSVSFNRLRSLAPVMQVPELARVRRLILEGFGLGKADAQAVASSPYVSNLAGLHLSDNRLGDEGAQMIARSPHLLRLDDLDLGENRIGDAGVTALAASPVVSTLSHLGLAGNPLTNTGALALASSPHLGRLTGLTLWNCPKIGSRGKEELKARFGDKVSFED